MFKAIGILNVIDMIKRINPTQLSFNEIISYFTTRNDWQNTFKYI